MPWWAPWVGTGVVFVVVATALWWWVPKWQANRLRMKIRDPKARADIEDNFRKTIGQLIGGAAVLVGTGFAYYQSQLAQQATHDQLTATYEQIEASKAQIISQQVAKGFEQLGSKDNIVLRLGGNYALEGVMNTSEQYHKPVTHRKSAAQVAHARDNDQIERIASPFIAEYGVLCGHPAHCILLSSRLQPQRSDIIAHDA
jgi:hypothetical protein